MNKKPTLLLPELLIKAKSLLLLSCILISFTFFSCKDEDKVYDAPYNNFFIVTIDGTDYSFKDHCGVDTTSAKPILIRGATSSGNIELIFDFPDEKVGDYISDPTLPMIQTCNISCIISGESHTSYFKPRGSGKLRIDEHDKASKIIKGSLEGKLFNEGNPNDSLIVNYGSFDIAY